jgi:hypothetical protein
MPDKLSLYQISAEGQFIEQCLVDAEGELSPDLEERLNALMVSGPKTIQAAGHVLSNLEAAQVACEMEAKRLHDRAKSIEAGIDKLRSRMTAALDLAFGGKLDVGTHKFSTQKAPDTYVVELAQEASLEQLKAERPDFVRTKLELDKTAIKDAFNKEQPLPDSVFVIKNPGKRFLRVK